MKLILPSHPTVQDFNKAVANYYDEARPENVPKLQNNAVKRQIWSITAVVAFGRACLP